MKAPLPLYEDERLAHLHRLHIFDTLPEQGFDDIAQLAMTLCEVPIAVVSLIDRDRQWFKSCLGLDARETPRDLAFCAHAILAPEDILVVEDALLDERFSDNLLVLGEPYIRFYAGAPLVTSAGYALGTLCIIDRVPRKLSALQYSTLKLLAGQVMQLLQLREANIALAQERKNLDDILKGANLGAWRWNVQTGETLLNERWAEMMGYSLAELAPISIATWESLVHPEDLAKAKVLLQKHFRGELPFYECQCRMKHKQGHWVIVIAHGRLISATDAGAPLWMSGTHSDITLAEEARTATKLSEQKLSALYNLAPVAIVLNNLADSCFIECNPEFERMIGYSADEIRQLKPKDITPPEYAQSDQDELENLLHSGRYGPYEKHYIHKDGHLIPVLLNGVLINTPAGEQHIWAFIQDITERKRIEQMKNDFVSAVSHELRTPLTSITGSLGLVANGLLGDMPDKMSHMIGIAYKNAQRLTVLINDLLDMEKLLAGKMVFDMRVQPLLPIVEQSLEANKAYADTFGVSLVLHAHSINPCVNIDSQRLQQVLANFISNAVKFSPAGSRVDVHLRLCEHYAEVAVVDQGPGVSNEFRSRIFQKFAQADSSDSRKRGGTGLGLAISKAFVERMQGSIGFESVPGQGATFFARFPVLD